MGGMTTSVTPPAETDAPQDAKRVLLAAPRGYCAGVDRAVVTVEKALELYGPPVYVRKEIVHNKHVVTTLERRGAIFVDETDEVPHGANLVFSAHGVSPAVRESAKQLELFADNAEAQARMLRGLQSATGYGGFDSGTQLARCFGRKAGHGADTLDGHAAVARRLAASLRAAAKAYREHDQRMSAAVGKTGELLTEGELR